MLFRTAAADRPYHLVRYPLETLPRGDPAPAQYAPTPPDPDGPKGPNVQPTVYRGGGDRVKAARG